MRVSVLKIGRHVLLLAALAPALGGCLQGTPVQSAAQATGFSTTPAEPKDFVKEGRRGEVDYIPVGTRVERPAKRITPAEFKTMESQLDAQRGSNEAAASQAKVLGSTPPPAPPKVQ
ncbi:MAG: hypothetical protein ACRC56_13215 [Bosea sp. (in: a-proteobacteria)]